VRGAVGHRAQDGKKDKMYQTMANLVYYHFRDIAECNKQICSIWESLTSKANQQETKNAGTQNPDLKLVTLNLLTLKELTHSSDNFDLSEFKTMLHKLKDSMFADERAHIQELIDVYGP
jgi:hypothetical protein